MICNEHTEEPLMRTFQIRSRGQLAIFAGIWLLAFVPFFQLGALLPQGYASATQQSAQANNYAPLVAWAAHHLGLAIAFPIIEIIPLVLVVRLPELLRSVIYGDGRGHVGQWCGVAGLVVIAAVTVLDMLQLVGAAHQLAQGDQSAIGASFRFSAILASLIANIVGGVLLAIWLVSVNVPLVRLGGFERVVGIVGVLGAALFAATAGLIAFNPQQPQGALAGSALALFGLWLILTGVLLTRRAAALGAAPSPDPSGDDTGTLSRRSTGTLSPISDGEGEISSKA
jgi:hypothetical protein